jgi:hypothetical protein
MTNPMPPHTGHSSVVSRNLLSPLKELVSPEPLQKSHVILSDAIKKPPETDY